MIHLMSIPDARLAIGDAVNMDEVNGIASNLDLVFRAANYGEVQELTRVIADKICSKGKHCRIKCSAISTGRLFQFTQLLLMSRTVTVFARHYRLNNI